VIKKISAVLVLILFFPLFLPALETDLNILSWNVESGGNSPPVIAFQLSEYRGYDIVSLQEVDDSNRELYGSVFGDGYSMVMSDSGARYNDHLLVIYDTDRFLLRQVLELHEFSGITITPNVKSGGKRSPLILFLTDRFTGADFIFITVHLLRTNKTDRVLQTIVLYRWIAEQNEPVLCAGDFNFDYNFTKGQYGNDSFTIFTYGGLIEWVKPEVLIDTNYSESKGKETYPDSILDFVFAAHGAEDWKISSEIVEREGDFPDTEETSDHRPVSVSIVF
jgi:endonuclease/exonuclease/phosphatase family metal-dependent hydrolase